MKEEEKDTNKEQAEKVAEKEQTEKSNSKEQAEKTTEKKEKESTKEKKSSNNAKPAVEVKSGKGNAFAITLSSIALVVAGAGAVFSYLSFEKANTPITILDSGSDGNTVSFTEGTVADIVDKVSESVVSIVTSTKTTSYFGQSYTGSAAGTGMIVTSDGYVLTNKHVIDGATKINVVLDDGTTYEDVKVAATDPLNDVAFLKISDVSDLKPVTLGDSKTVSVGQQVIAIGNALGQYQNSVTSGIVSGTGRSLTASDSTGTKTEKLSDMIQTDAAINSGNSGGPLVNAAGEVIGINTATTSSAENMGFAIPISSVKGMLKQLTKTGKASRAYVGVYGVDITAEVAKEYNLPVSYGAYLYSSSKYSSVIKDTPAEKAGLKDKDIITKVNNAKVGEQGSLSSLVGEYEPGDTVQLTVIREGKEIGIKVTLGSYSE